MMRSITFARLGTGGRKGLARVLIAGCGYVGSVLAEELAHDGHEVWGLRRRVTALPDGVRPLEADLALPATLAGLPPGLDFVFYLAAPGGSDDALYRTAYVEGLGNLLAALEREDQGPRRVVFVSSTAVYAQTDGSWVDEDSPTEPQHFSSRRLLEGEALLAASPFARVVVRFGGIYGPRRDRLIEKVRTARAHYHAKPPQYTNRIHRDDCAGALRHLMGVASPETRYVGVDSDPAAEETVLNWLAGTLGAPVPARAGPEEPRSSRGNKRCRNARLLESGYALRYPTFREGYSAVLSGQD
jgi:nucleoside-diphosphate-sugar epimerase